MFAARHQWVCVTTFCGAGSAWNLPGHSGMACQELCLEIPELGWCLLVSHRLVLVTYLPSLPRSLSACLIWFLSLPILPQISHPEPPMWSAPLGSPYSGALSPTASLRLWLHHTSPLPSQLLLHPTQSKAVQHPHQLQHILPGPQPQVTACFPG